MVDKDLKTHMLRTYLSLRMLIVVVTMAFLVALPAYWVFGNDMQKDKRNSISAYYHHPNKNFPMHDVFVGALVSVGLLLIAYQGYTDKENLALNIAGVGLLCVVAFPMPWGQEDPEKSVLIRIRAIVHYASAILFFLAISYVAVFRARDTLEVMKNENTKAMFKRLYWAVGAMMFLSPVVWLVAKFVLEYRRDVYLIEYIGVYFFLAYWIIKSFELNKTKLETEDKINEVAAAHYAAKA